MNKRVKIVATLGPAVEIRGGKKFGDDGYWGEKLELTQIGRASCRERV